MAILYPLFKAALTVVTALSFLNAAVVGSHLSIYNELGAPTFRSPRNVLFAVVAGGSSHTSWVAQILNELSKRGHSITFASTGSHLRFFKPYPQMKGVSFGNETVDYRLGQHVIREPRTWDGLRSDFKLDTDVYEPIYNDMKNVISNQQFDVVISDFFCPACIDAAYAANIPTILTVLFNPVSASSESTTDRISLWLRFYKKFFYPVQLYWNLATELEKFEQQRQKCIGFVPEDNTRHSLVIINNLYGIEEARPMEPLSEMIGPIYNGAYDPLPPAIQKFLENHERVVFGAFGQHAAMTRDEAVRVLVGLLNALETGLIDGFMWVPGRSIDGNARTLFPNTVTTASGQEYRVEDLYRDHPHARLSSWAPQFAILQHPSVITFLSHGGGTSLFEVSYAGKRAVIIPFFGDQLANAVRLDRAQVAVHLDISKLDDILEALRRVIQDKDGVLQSNVKRYQALMQIRAQHAVARGADLVEEVIFATKDGILPHRQDVAKKMSFLKANNYDLYLCLAAIVMGLGWAIRFAHHSWKVYYQKITQEKKLKQN
ncbi:hypothetical protein BDB00DRAFT_808570 [Zychaea mexicana]|uniref:uncharacterized protein n=1 Tax=Zychaea mexicana TaxID=64656 RepID=UPI0022FEA8DB|nr:uncharacterized protein BDB00DRAFT_808570 [Zychaea mexicana]KAI9496739.1 hypothetical protein BDB00DRAFT_808570 [Zychaea mexicana]